jgi:3-hydroxyisobutyrate dehydrogenase
VSDRAKSVAILGTGIIGAAMARNAVAAGLKVAVWNRTPAVASPLAEHGIEVFADAKDAVEGRDIVVSVLSNDAVTLDVVAPLLTEFAEGAVWIQSATIGIDGTERAAQLAKEAGVRLIDAPVSGTKTPAERGELVMLASGDQEAAEFAAPFLDAVGAKTVWLGEAGNGSKMKLVTNDWVLTQTTLLAEAIRFCAALGLQPAAFLAAIDGAPVGSSYAQAKGAMILAGDYPANFPLEHGAKDARLIAETAREHGLDLPLAEGTERAFEAALEDGRGREDVAAIYDYVGEKGS